MFPDAKCETGLFQETRFRNENVVDFSNAVFDETLVFDGAAVDGPVSFERAKCGNSFMLRGAHFANKVSFYRATVEQLIFNGTHPFQLESLDLRNCTFDVREETVQLELIDRQDPMTFTMAPYTQLA
jgi:hypothetical protein